MTAQRKAGNVLVISPCFFFLPPPQGSFHQMRNVTDCHSSKTQGGKREKEGGGGAWCWAPVLFQESKGTAAAPHGLVAGQYNSTCTPQYQTERNIQYRSKTV